MRKESLNRSILKLAIPNIISNITVPLLGFVDMMLMGHQDSIAYIGAMAPTTVPRWPIRSIVPYALR